MGKSDKRDDGKVQGEIGDGQTSKGVVNPIMMPSETGVRVLGGGNKHRMRR